MKQICKVILTPIHTEGGLSLILFTTSILIEQVMETTCSIKRFLSHSSLSNHQYNQVRTIKPTVLTFLYPMLTRWRSEALLTGKPDFSDVELQALSLGHPKNRFIISYPRKSRYTVKSINKTGKRLEFIYLFTIPSISELHKWPRLTDEVRSFDRV